MVARCEEVSVQEALPSWFKYSGELLLVAIKTPPAPAAEYALESTPAVGPAVPTQLYGTRSHRSTLQPEFILLAAHVLLLQLV